MVQETLFGDIKLTVIGQGIGSSAGGQYTTDRHPKGQDRKGKYSPPHLFESGGGVEEETVQQQKRDLDKPKHRVQGTVGDRIQRPILSIQIQKSGVGSSGFRVSCGLQSRLCTEGKLFGNPV